MRMPSKKKMKTEDNDTAVKDTQQVNRSLLEDSLSLAATQRGVNEDSDMEARERIVEGAATEKRKAKK